MQRLRALTLTEVLVVIVVCAILAAIFVDQSTTTRWSIERRIRNWKPTAADRHQPDHSILAADANIVGEWTVRRRFNSTSMIFTEEAPSKFAIEFSTGGCLGRCEFSRTAHFAEGILTIDEPVSEYLPVVYDKLYAIRCDGDDLLLPSAFVRIDPRGTLPQGGARWNWGGWLKPGREQARTRFLEREICAIYPSRGTFVA